MTDTCVRPLSIRQGDLTLINRDALAQTQFIRGLWDTTAQSATSVTFYSNDEAQFYNILPWLERCHGLNMEKITESSDRGQARGVL